MEAAMIDEGAGLAELANRGVGKAAATLGRLIGGDVRLSVPSVDILAREAAAVWLNAGAAGGLVAVGEAFRGRLLGAAMLVLPEENSLDLVRAALPEDVGINPIGAVEHESLSEIGNIVLNGCLSALAGRLDAPLRTSLPFVLCGDAFDIFDNCGVAADPDARVILFHTRLDIRARTIAGQIAVVLDAPSTGHLKSLAI